MGDHPLGVFCVLAIGGVKVVRERVLRVRLSLAEWGWVQSLASLEGRKPSEAVRESLRESAARRGLLPVRDDGRRVPSQGVTHGNQV